MMVSPEASASAAAALSTFISAACERLDLYRVCQIALDVSVDWLLGCSDVIEVPHVEEDAGNHAKRSRRG